MQLHNTEIQGFSRLKGFFHHGINYSNYDQIIPMTKRPIIGNIPKDILDLVIHKNPKNKDQAIQNIQNAYIEASKILFEAQKLLVQAINRFSPSEDKAIDVIFKHIGILESSKDKIYEEKLSECLIKAEEVLIKEFKKVFPNLNNIILSPIDIGTFGDVYKCQLLDSKQEKIVGDKVIKIFQPDMSLFIKSYEKILKLLEKYSNKEIIELGAKKGFQYNEEILTNYRTAIIDLINECKSKEASKYFAKKHGAFAEANSSEYIKFMSGHKVNEKEGLLLPDLYVLSEPSFHVAKYLDSSCKAEKTFNFKRLGLEHEDLDVNPDNAINNVCIDLGGISAASKVEDIFSTADIFLSNSQTCAKIEENKKSLIIGNKENTKILKKIVDNNGHYPKGNIDKIRLIQVTKEIIDKKLI